MRLINVERPQNTAMIMPVNTESQYDNLPAAQLLDVEFLAKMFPGKALFTMEETAKILNVSYEFIRSRVVSGQIVSVPFGKRNMISITELARLINQGLPS